MGQWNRHPNTRKLASLLLANIGSAHVHLLQKAAGSSDPEVRAAYARHEQAQAALQQLNAIEPEKPEDE